MMRKAIQTMLVLQGPIAAKTQATAGHPTPLKTILQEAMAQEVLRAEVKEVPEPTMTKGEVVPNLEVPLRVPKALPTTTLMITMSQLAVAHSLKEMARMATKTQRMGVPVAGEALRQAEMGRRMKIVLILVALVERMAANSLAVDRRAVLSQPLAVPHQTEVVAMKIPTTREEMQGMRPANPLRHENRVLLRVSQELGNQLSRHRLLLTPSHQATL
jgi:hypothetical protein